MISLLALVAGASAAVVIQFESFALLDSTCSSPLPLGEGVFAIEPDKCMVENGTYFAYSTTGNTITMTTYSDVDCEVEVTTQDYESGACVEGTLDYGRFTIVEVEVVGSLWTFSGYESTDCSGTRETRSGSGLRCQSEDGAGVSMGTTGNGIAHFDVYGSGNCESSLLAELSVTCNACVEYAGVGSMMFDCTSSSASVVSSLVMVLGMVLLAL